jgi:hypothetical protein
MSADSYKELRLGEAEQEILDVALRDSKPLAPVSTFSQEELDGHQRRSLRQSIQWKVFITLWVQLAALLILMLLQGFKVQGFMLNDWALGFLANGTLVETFFIVQFIVKHLFPQEPRR